MNVALRFAGYGFRYSTGKAPAIANVNLELAGGRITAVIAPQGVGKTTLLRAAAGLLGEIYDGDTTGSVDAGPVRPAAFFDGYVQVTLAVETVREEIGLPLLAAGVGRAGRDLRATAVARELGIEYLLDRPVTHLSGGEEKLVGVAAALIPDAMIHVLDEPFEQLDVPHFVAVVRAAKRRARAGRLILIATGSLDTAINIADNAVIHRDGEWRVVDAPTYSDVAHVGQSPVMTFLAERAPTARAVRRFRDAVRQTP